jgi:hypothetical protein
MAMVAGKPPRKSTVATRSHLLNNAMESMVAPNLFPRMSRCAKAGEGVLFPAWLHLNLFFAKEKGAHVAPQKTKHI